MRNHAPFSTTRWKTLGIAVCLLAILAVPQPAAANREIRLGGSDKHQGDKPPADIVALPTIHVAIRKPDGGWHHIQIDAWLAPNDKDLAGKMESVKTVIVRKATANFPLKPFPSLVSAHDGSRLAKEVIHSAAARSIGREWQGDVLIRNIVVY
jgi:hypothetical protein